MSITSTPTVRCTNCGSPDDDASAPYGYCSAACYYRERGEAVLNRVHDHGHLCNTCYGRLRVVEPAGELWVRGPDHPNRPDKGPKNVADGVQYPTPNKTTGIDETEHEHFPPTFDTRWSCKCGNVNPDNTIAELQQVDPWGVRDNLFYALRFLADREAIDREPDLDAYYDALGEKPFDAAYAVGRAICGDA